MQKPKKTKGEPEAKTGKKNGNGLQSQTNYKSAYLMLLFLFVCFFSVKAQMMPAWPPKMKADLIPIQGGEEGKNYAVIIKTPMNKKNLVDATTKFLAQWKLVDLNNVQLDEISDEQAEYSIPFELRQSFSSARFMGANTPFPAVVLMGDLRFEFHDNGNVMIVFDNYTERTFFLVNKENHSINLGGGTKPPDVEEYFGHWGAAALENSFIVKALVVVNKGLDGLKEFSASLNEYFNELDKKYELFRKLEKAGQGEWLSDETFLHYAGRTDFGKANYSLIIEQHKKYFDEGRLLTINQVRWNDRIRPVVANLYKAISIALDGEIEGVAEDGEQTYINMDGTVLPIDPKWKNMTPPDNAKDRENYIKKNKKNEY